MAGAPPGFAGPGIAAGRRVSQPVSLTDLVPTLREVERVRKLLRLDPPTRPA